MKTLIIGNGPSIERIKPEIFENYDLVIGCNHIYKMFDKWNYQTDIIIITDHNRIKETGKSLVNYKGELYIGDERYHKPPVKKIRKILNREFIPIKQRLKTRFQNILFRNLKYHRFLYNIIFDKENFAFTEGEDFNFGHSVIISAIQLAIIKGSKEIHLHGVDSDYSKPYALEIAVEAQYKNPTFMSNPRLKMEPILVTLQIQMESLNICLFDITPNGKLKYISKKIVENA
jgi:hypothetical protein